MPRKPTPTTELVSGEVLPAERILDQQNAAALMHDQQQAQVRAVALQIGYQLPADCTDPDLIMRDIAANMRRSVEACLEVGRGLRVLKEACEHGNFIERLDVLGLERTVAVRFMQTAGKFSNVATSQHLIKAIGSQSKLFEMLILDDGQIEELELTGQTGELKLDDIATMSVKELRATLREVRADKEAQARLMTEKDIKLNDLATKLTSKSSRVVVPTPDEEGAAIRSEASAFAFEAEATLRGKLNAAFETLAAHTEKSGTPHDDFMSGLLCQIELATNQLRSQYFIKSRPDGDNTPDWERNGSDEETNSAVARAAAGSGWTFNASGQMVPAGE